MKTKLKIVGFMVGSFLLLAGGVYGIRWCATTPIVRTIDSQPTCYVEFVSWGNHRWEVHDDRYGVIGIAQSPEEAIAIRDKFCGQIR